MVWHNRKKGVLTLSAAAWFSALAERTAVFEVGQDERAQGSDVVTAATDVARSMRLRAF